MDEIIVILLVLAAVKFVFFGVILLVVFKPDLKQWRHRKPASGPPVCMYCQSRWTHRRDEGETRWDDEQLVLVTEYECEHCHLPFWHVERIQIPSGRRAS